MNPKQPAGPAMTLGTIRELVIFAISRMAQPKKAPGVSRSFKLTGPLGNRSQET